MGPPSRTPWARWRRRVFWAYVVLLVLSHGVRWLQPEPAADPTSLAPNTVLEPDTVLEPNTGSALSFQRHSVELPAVTGPTASVVDASDGSTVQLSYLEWRPAADPEAPVVLLLHGSPGSASNFLDLGPILAERHRVIAPDLPGFGGSTWRVPDYSIASHGVYVRELLDHLGIATAHVVGFSMGGGVALHLWEMEPARVQSIVMLSAIGVQELELLGQYHLNHAVHGLQLGAFWLLFEGVPHFGLLDRGREALSYARNFFDTDQRPLRGVLERYDGPMLIVHGEGDVLVPVAAAREHYRIVPQSEMLLTDANHFMVFRDPEVLRPIGDFVDRVDVGEAQVRSTAEPARIAAAEDPNGFQPPPITGFALTITLVLLALATLVSEDLSCIAAGLLVARGSLGFVEASMACGLGIFFGDMMLYGLGRLGRPWLAKAPLRWIVSPADVERSSQWFERRGPIVILFSRFMPGFRLPTYVSAGLLRMGFLSFTISLLIPVALWTPLLVGLSQTLGESFFATFEQFQRYALPGFVLFLLSLWILMGLTRSLGSWRGRRLWVGWWQRQRAWEFWPPWRFYPPVVLSVLRLGWTYRSPTLFTAANPGIPNGSGFIGESKLDILGRLDPAWVAAYAPLPGGEAVGERRGRIEAFMERRGLDFPVVLKPDQGQRGSGVTIARDDDQVNDFLEAQRGDAIVQEYVGGPELGVFYVRLPSDDRGRIFSVTEKLLPTVLGDGRSTVEQLILKDSRAVAMAHAYFAVLGGRLDEVPSVGETVTLVDLGTHCRGAVFLDGNPYVTDAMEETFETIARSFDGFYFGRFDARAPSLEAFQAGRDIRILELNGVTSEATHIYDPKFSVGEARDILREQWRLAFEIGDRNRQRGHQPLSLWQLARLLIDFRRRETSP